YLRALEDEEWSLLPGYTFTKAFLRTYADMLGLDGRTIVDEFKRQYPDPSEIELSPSPPSRRDNRARGRERPGERGGRQAGPSGRVLLIALLVVLVAAAVFIVHELDKKKSAAPPAQTTTTNTTSKNHTKPKHPPSTAGPIALRLTAVTPVHVCLIGYVTERGTVHQRLPPKGSAATTALLTPGARAPFYHDNHFRVSFSGGKARMTIGSKTSSVDASATTRSYEVGRSGRHLLSATQAPHCQ
ncbi:MAG TPA: helix-turn-helix transcriptional regulator, partial [Solirubrobacteraceae bacterium]